MANCKCAGSSCSCSVTAGSGVGVTGTGTAANPFVISVNPLSLSLGNVIQTSDSSTIDFTKTGTGGSGDPVVLTARVLLVSPNGTKYTLAVSNAGALSAVTTT